jgi:glycosyltransferase involved in cell wall biosynthesis
MRIVYVLTSLGMGGAERQVLALASRMAERGHAVALVVLRPQVAEEWPTEIEVTRLGMHRSALSVIEGLRRGGRFLRAFQPDLIHSHSFHANFVARLLKISLRKAAVISTIHNVNEGGWHRMLAYRLTDSLCDCTTAVSSAAAERFIRLGAVPKGKCGVVTNGIDTDEFCSDDERRARMRGSMDAATDFIWLAAGRITPAKDFPNLLRAFDFARSKFPNTQLWIAGQGDAAAAVREAGLEGDFDRVRWVGLRRDMPALMDAADGFVLSSAWEGMPLVLGEAMAMEKPVVATDVGGVRELVGEAGLLVPPHRFELLAEAMLKTMRMTAEEREGVGCAARKLIVTQFGVDARVEEWEELYWEVRKKL